MKVGIVTFHWAYNYGAVLQAYALCQEVSSMGHDVEFVDYNPFVVPQEKGKGFNFGLTDGSLVRRMKKAVRKIKNYNLSRRYGKDFFQGFDRFRTEYLPGSGELDLANTDYDAIIVGSDQVWNASWIGDSISYYYLCDFENVTKISYAACVGNDRQPETYKDKIRNCLDDFSSISVRNNVTSEYVQQVSGQLPEMVCDPTFLHGFDAMSKKGGSLAALPEKFILVYALDQHLEQLGTQIVGQLKEKLRLPVVSISSVFHTGWTFKEADHIIYNASPAEWLWLFENGAFVCTDSFHGLVFSLKNRKPLLGFRDEGWRSFRLTDLMQHYQLNERLLTAYDSKSVEKLLACEIDYTSVAEVTAKDVADSLFFLRNALRKTDVNA